MFTPLLRNTQSISAAALVLTPGARYLCISTVTSLSREHVCEARSENIRRNSKEGEEVKGEENRGEKWKVVNMERCLDMSRFRTPRVSAGGLLTPLSPKVISKIAGSLALIPTLSSPSPGVFSGCARRRSAPLHRENETGAGIVQSRRDHSPCFPPLPPVHALLLPSIISSSSPTQPSPPKLTKLCKLIKFFDAPLPPPLLPTPTPTLHTREKEKGSQRKAVLSEEKRGEIGYKLEAGNIVDISGHGHHTSVPQGISSSRRAARCLRNDNPPCSESCLSINYTSDSSIQ
ncbi:hypothetical protein C0Q70_15568 [Pomacea canaliculata]|uniref:Uncharacterized protein n=1 Tax=Pomacea canaliculata TaxID=400727 RepID=A0A2T7NV69_POMCA|nr:hypothetical protein C0Q70_15568 [Pomacea canaliculata]